MRIGCSSPLIDVSTIWQGLKWSEINIEQSEIYAELIGDVYFNRIQTKTNDKQKACLKNFNSSRKGLK